MPRPSGPIAAWTTTQLKRELAELNRLLARARDGDRPTVVVVHRVPPRWRPRPGQHTVRRLTGLAGRYLASVPERQRVVVEYPRQALAAWAAWRHDVLVDELRVRQGKPSRLPERARLAARLDAEPEYTGQPGGWRARTRAEHERTNKRNA